MEYGIFLHYIIYTIILLKSAGHNSCSIVLGNVSNCSYRLTVSRVRVSILPSIFLYAKNIQNYSEYRVGHASGQLNRTSDAGNCGHGSSPPTSRNGNELSGDNILWARLIASGRRNGDNMNGDNCCQNGDNESLYLHGLKMWSRN